MMTSLRRSLSALTLAPVLLAATCFEPPVKERMDIQFLAGDRTLVTVGFKLAVAEPSSHEGEADRRVRERVEEARLALLQGRDEWTARFERARPVKERIVWEREGNVLSRLVRSGLFESPEGLKRFLSDTLLGVTFNKGEGWSEIAVYAAGGSRASSQQQRQSKEHLADWSSSVSDYVFAGRALYQYLDGSPGRAEACFSKLFGEARPLGGGGGESVTSDTEDRLIEPLNEAMEELLGVFSVPEEKSHSFEEISRIVYDPFPAPLTIRVAGKILEVEGFHEQGGDGRLSAPPLSFFGALQGLEGRWLSPDPLLFYYDHYGRGTEEPLDIKAFLSQARWAARSVTAEEVGSAIESQLVPAPVYRVRWRTQSSVDGTSFDWKDLEFDD